MKILLVIPAFDEEPTIRGLVEGARKFVPDVLVVDDGSNDATTLTAGLAGAMIDRVNENRGKGEALKRAFEFALSQGYDVVLTMDGDGQHDPADLANFLPILDQYDLILGNRMSEAEKVPLLRRIANQSASIMVSILCGRRIYDSQTGYRAYSANLLRGIKLTSSRYDLESEVIIKAARKGLRIGHTHIQTIYGTEVSRFRIFIDSVRFLRVVFKSLTWW